VLIKKSFAYEFCEVYRYYQIILIIPFSARFIFFTTHSASSLYWPSRPAGIYPAKSAPADNQCLLPDGLRPALPKALLPRDRQTAPDINFFVLHPSRASL
jgi:hypothetical protein